MSIVSIEKACANCPQPRKLGILVQQCQANEAKEAQYRFIGIPVVDSKGIIRAFSYDGLLAPEQKKAGYKLLICPKQDTQVEV